MHDRTFFIPRFLVVVVLALGAFGCGRTSLLDDVPFDAGIVDAHVDARPDGSEAGGCNASNCPSGCCDHGVCEQGGELKSCGAFGQACRDCQSTGYDYCDTLSHACARYTSGCDFNSCADGCCEGTTCLAGIDPNECGISGQSCQHCAASALSCDANSRSCTIETCGPESCPGCCIGDVCQIGTDQSACGANGQQCTNCLAVDEACAPQGAGGACSAQTCNGSNCAGCCDGNTCRVGTDDFACGAGGSQCSPCSPSQSCLSGPSKGGVCVGNTGSCGPNNCKGCCQGDTCMTGMDTFACGIAGKLCQFCAGSAACSNGVCQGPTTCSPSTCAGCCDAQGLCEGGFLGGACGSSGVSCIDCAAQGATCGTGLNPRVCTNQQQTCPAPYGGCPVGITQTAYPIQHVCSANDLQQGQAACNTANSAGCQSFFAFEQANNPSCAKCLAPFDFSFGDGAGVLACTAPFVDAACNHNAACVIDCDDESCAKCPTNNATAQCRSNVSTGQCASLVNNLGCEGVALQGPASFCNPGNYPGFGGWLQGVGGHYCGP